MNCLLCLVFARTRLAAQGAMAHDDATMDAMTHAVTRRCGPPWGRRCAVTVNRPWHRMT